MKLGILLMIIFLLMGCLSENHPFLPYDTLQPEEIGDGWEISTPAQENIDGNALSNIFNDLHNDQSLWQLRSLLVFRNNKLVAETYLKDLNDRTHPRAIWSCTKQVLAVLVGIALEQGHIRSLDDSISSYLPNEIQGHPDKASISLGNLLTMRSGIGFDERNDASKILQRLPDNTLQFILGLPMIYPSGQTYDYNSGNPHLVAAAIQNEVGMATDEWADEIFFSRIGFSNYNWLRYDNYSFGGWGISTTPRELAKIAHVVLNRGAWNSEQIVDSLWIDEMLSPHVQTSDNTHLGYLWWVADTEIGTLFYMAGSGGQYAVLVMEKQLVIIGMSEHDTDGNLEFSFDRFFEIVRRINAISN